VNKKGRRGKGNDDARVPFQEKVGLEEGSKGGGGYKGMKKVYLQKQHGLKYNGVRGKSPGPSEKARLGE